MIRGPKPICIHQLDFTVTITLRGACQQRQTWIISSINNIIMDNWSGTGNILKSYCFQQDLLPRSKKEDETKNNKLRVKDICIMFATLDTFFDGGNYIKISGRFS